MNSTQLIGRLGRDPQITRNDNEVIVNMSIATKEFWRDAAGARVEHTEWHQVVCFDRLAEIAEAYLRSGDEVWLEGNLRTKQWADKEGKERKTTQLRVTGMRMLRQAPDKDRVQQTINTLSAIIELLKKPPEEVKLTNEEIAHMVDLARGNLMV